ARKSAKSAASGSCSGTRANPRWICWLQIWSRSGDGAYRSCYHKKARRSSMCGIFGIANHADAANLTYLGLYALQHRGQESTGISSSNGEELFTHRAMGHVADVFTQDVLSQLQGFNAVGHTRYSTAGESVGGNAQPIVVKSSPYGPIALCHNGNLINAVSLRADLEEQGAIFQSTTDTEVILHLLARSQADTLLDALGETLPQLQGAFSLLLLTQDSLIGI